MYLSMFLMISLIWEAVCIFAGFANKRDAYIPHKTNYGLMMEIVIGIFFVLLFISLICLQSYNMKKAFVSGKYRIVEDVIAWERIENDGDTTWDYIGCKNLQAEVLKGPHCNAVVNEPVYVLQRSDGKSIEGYCARNYSISSELMPYFVRPFQNSMY